MKIKRSKSKERIQRIQNAFNAIFHQTFPTLPPEIVPPAITITGAEPGYLMGWIGQGGERVGNVVFYSGRKLKLCLTMLKRAGIQIIQDIPYKVDFERCVLEEKSYDPPGAPAKKRMKLKKKKKTHLKG